MINESLSILIADDHPIFRSGLREILQSIISDCKIVEANDGKEVIKLLESDKLKPEIAILDIDMAEIDGLEVCRYIKKNESHIKTIILTVHNEIDIYIGATEAGADGFMVKENSARELEQCINDILSGKSFISSEFASKKDQIQKLINKGSSIKKLLSELSQSEYKTLKLLLKNYSSKEIGERLFVTSKSVDNYRSRICKKLNIEGGSNSLFKWIFENKEMLKDM